MNYIEVKIQKPPDQDQTDLLIDELSEIGFESFVEEENQLLAYISEKEFKIQLLEQSEYVKSLSPDQIELSNIPDQNWNAVWESNYPPVKIGNRCCIRAPFHEPDASVEFDIILRPKMAFGTAHHETTAMMIELLLEEELTGKRVLDMGCGTAVLAILAARKGAAEIVAIDNDEWAYRNAVENIELNGIDKIRVAEGDAAILQQFGQFDLVLANINKNILLADMDLYANAMSKGAKIMLSGFYQEELEDIKNAAKPNGMNFVSGRSRNNWVAAVFTKQ